jgi:hypothetical protein
MAQMVDGPLVGEGIEAPGVAPVALALTVLTIEDTLLLWNSQSAS